VIKISTLTTSRLRKAPLGISGCGLTTKNTNKIYTMFPYNRIFSGQIYALLGVAASVIHTDVPSGCFAQTAYL